MEGGLLIWDIPKRNIEILIWDGGSIITFAGPSQDWAQAPQLAQQSCPSVQQILSGQTLLELHPQETSIDTRR